MRKYVISVISLLIIVQSLVTIQVDSASQKTSIKFNNGVYYGEVKNGVPNGKGTISWSENKTYSGDWLNGKRSGYGKYIALIKENGDYEYKKYNGYWKNDTYNGQGEYVYIHSYTIDGSGYENSQTTIKNGEFLSGELKTGYTMNNPKDLPYIFDYNDNKVGVGFASYPEDVKNHLSKNFNQGYIPLLSYVVKQTNGLIKGYSYYLGMEEDRQELSEGFFKKDWSLNSGVNLENTNDYEFYTAKEFKNGKLISTKQVNGDINEIITKKIKVNLKVLLPYVSGFNKLYNTSISEMKNFEQRKNNSETTKVTSNSTQESTKNNLGELREYSGSWVLEDINENGEISYPSVITIFVENNTSGFVTIYERRIQDRDISKEAIVESKFVVNDEGVAKFTFDDDGYGHIGTVEIRFTNAGLIVTCESHDPQIVREDGTIYRESTGNWSLWEGSKSFNWNTKRAIEDIGSEI
ncbi:hypothetical protein NYE24_00590 [Paenibacillus sp. FSL H7-0350]|uniref:hypothetical protein n=1 Tax=Paenibacillus sp. FSL H7-0350 TaxID=2975345 RepID=UPI00315830BA